MSFINKLFNIKNTPKSEDEINLRVFSPLGKRVNIKIKTTATFNDLKNEAYIAFNEIPNSFLSNVNNIDELKIIETKNKRYLVETLQLKDSNVKENDEYVLLKRKSQSLNIEIYQPGPPLQEVMHATKDVQSTRVSPPTVNIDELVSQNSFQKEIRKILISLAQSSAFVIGGGPYAVRLISFFKHRLINRRRHDANSVECLIDMGFTKEQSIYALKLKNGVYAAALDWLIENQSTMNLLDYNNFSSLSTSGNNLNASKDNVETLLEIIRIYAHKKIPPPIEMINSIVEMGFSEADVIEALRATRNSEAAACEWLVGIRTKSLTELRDGLPQESPIFKALLQSPQIQVSLGNPKSLIAYLSILENYSAIQMWLNDDDTSNAIHRIFTLFHDEKQIVALNQFNTV